MSAGAGPRLRTATILGAALATVALCGRADAYVITTGYGPFCDGIVRFSLMAQAVIGVIAIALLAGLAGKECAVRVTAALPCAWVLGGVTGILAGDGRVSSMVGSGGALMLIGVLVAADRRLGNVVPLAIAVLFGGVHGRFDGRMAAHMSSPALALLGIWLEVLLVTAAVSAVVVAYAARPGWQRIVVRVAGSWITAIGLLFVAWGLKR